MITSVEEYFRLLKSEVPQDYHRITEDVLSEELCFQLIDQYPEYRKWVACNRHVSLEVLRVLAKDKNVSVRWKTGARENVDEEIIELLSRDPDESVRHSVVFNLKTPLHILERLSQDEWERCAKDAQRKLIERRGQKP